MSGCFVCLSLGVLFSRLGKTRHAHPGRGDAASFITTPRVRVPCGDA